MSEKLSLYSTGRLLFKFEKYNILEVNFGWEKKAEALYLAYVLRNLL
jgi:hypothetical protein